MAHANAIFLSLVSGAALVLGVAPGCSSSAAPAPSAAITYAVLPGTNSPTVCGVGGGVTWNVGNPEGNPIVTVADGSSNAAGVPITVACSVTSTSTGFHVQAQADYGNQGSFTINGAIAVAPGENPGPQTGVQATFTSGAQLGFTESLSGTDCTVTFTKNARMGVAASRIWGYIDCPQASATDGTTCDGSAEFLFEYCSD
jgi:hypothetical protein